MRTAIVMPGWVPGYSPVDRRSHWAESVAVALIRRR